MNALEETPPAEVDDCLVCAVFKRLPARKPSTGFTCGPCLVEMRRQLKDLPELYVWAGGEMLPGSPTGARGSERSIGLRVGALDLRWAGDVLCQLTDWCQVWREDFELLTWVEPISVPSPDPTGATLVQVVRFVDSLLARIAATHPSVDEFATNLVRLHSSAVSAARVGERQAWVVSCPADLGSGTCGKRIRVTGEDFGGELLCRGCNTMWDVMRLLHVSVSDATSTIWLPAAELSLLYGIGESTLRRWAAAGEVTRSHGRYDVAQVRARSLEGMRLKEA